MLIIKTKLKSYPRKGIGLVADENIKKGQIICRDDFKIDREFKDNDLKGTKFKAFRLFLQNNATYGKVGKNYYWHLHVDNMRFMNHSEKPNVKWNDTKEWEYVALKDIKKGREITCNYKQFEEHLTFKVY